MSIRATIISQVQQIVEENGTEGDLPRLTDDLPLADSGLDSLMIAILVTRLEDTLGFDPFSDFTEDSYPVTLGDFIKLYENAAIRSDIAAGQNR